MKFLVAIFLVFLFRSTIQVLVFDYRWRVIMRGWSGGKKIAFLVSEGIFKAIEFIFVMAFLYEMVKVIYK